MSEKCDTSWNYLYRAGGICAWLYIVIALIIPFLLYVDHTALSHMYRGADIIALINGQGFLWWTVLQTTVLGTSFFAIITFSALYFALSKVHKGFAFIGAITAIVVHILFIAYYPVLLGLGSIAQHYLYATSSDQAELLAAAAGLIAINNAFNPLYESVFAVSIFFLSLAMLRGVFRKFEAFLGIFTSAAAILALSLWGVVGIGYLWWWIFFMIWFILLGWRLFNLGKAGQ